MEQKLHWRRCERDEAEPDKAEALEPLLKKMKTMLGDYREGMCASLSRLADSPSRIVSDEENPFAAVCSRCCGRWARRRFLRQKPTLEINPDRGIVRKLLARPDDAVTEDAAWLLLDQALLMEGVPLPFTPPILTFPLPFNVTLKTNSML